AKYPPARLRRKRQIPPRDHAKFRAGGKRRIGDDRHRSVAPGSFQSRRARAEVLAYEPVATPLSATRAGNRKILARLNGGTNPHWRRRRCSTRRLAPCSKRCVYGFFRCSLTIACPSAVCLGSPFHAWP